MKEREELEQAITHLESQREILGDAAADAAISAVRQKLSGLVRKDEGASSDQGDLSLLGERRLVTIMFADVSGFTSLSEKMDPEAVREIMNKCFELLVPAIREYGGTIDKFIGDAVMALFGAPVAHENGPERALLAALQMNQELAAYNADNGLHLGLHFGINTGPVIAGGIGARDQQEYSVMGDAVNVAKRLEEASETGEILVGPQTYRYAAHLFDFDVLKPIRVKGRREPVAVYRLLERKLDVRDAGPLRRSLSSRLVGRRTELNELRSCVDRLTKGEGGILCITGEAGLGKSRLISELSTYAPEVTGSSPVRWLEGRTLSFGQTISYWPFQEILWKYAGITEHDTESEAWEKLGSCTKRLFADKYMEVLPYLASLIGLEVKGEYAERVKYLDGEAMRRQLFLTSRLVFERLAQTEPLVVVFEDLHWIDESSALLIEHLLPLVERLPLLICWVSRPELDSPVGHLRALASATYADRYTEINLSPLSPEQSAELIGNILRSDLVPDTLRKVLQKAEGNPFFLEEIIGCLIDQGVVVQDAAGDRWVIEGKIEDIIIPDTVQGVVMARIDRLQDDLKQVLRTAAVIGRSFLYRVLQATSRLGVELDDRLAQLKSIEVIREKQYSPELEYMFRHALAQQATYESILIQKRRELHARVAAVIESLFSERLDEFSALLAYHYAKAEAWEKAQAYLFKAADQSGRLAADAEALALYGQALVAYERAFGDRWAPLQRASLERKVGEALFRSGNHAQAVARYQSALKWLGVEIPRSRWSMRLGMLSEIVKQVASRAVSGSLPKPISERVTPEQEEELRLYELICWIDAWGNNERLLYLVTRGLNVGESVGFSKTAKGFMGMGLASDLLAMFRLAAFYHGIALPAAERTGHPDCLSLAHTGLSTHYMCLAKWDLVIEHARHASRFFQQTGDLHGWGYVAYLGAFATAMTGAYDVALAQSIEIARQGDDLSDPQVRCFGLTIKGFFLRRMGRFDEATDTLMEARSLAESTHDFRFSVFAKGELARCSLAGGFPAKAIEEFEDSLRIQSANKSASVLWVPYLSGIAEAYLAAIEAGIQSGQKDNGRRADWACRKALRHGRRYIGVRPEAMRLKGTYEWILGRPRAAKKWWNRSADLATKLGQPYDLVMTLLEMGERLNERDLLKRAESVLAGMGGEWDLNRLRFRTPCR